MTSSNGMEGKKNCIHSHSLGVDTQSYIHIYIYIFIYTYEENNFSLEIFLWHSQPTAGLPPVHGMVPSLCLCAEQTTRPGTLTLVCLSCPHRGNTELICPDRRAMMSHVLCSYLCEALSPFTPQTVLLAPFQLHPPVLEPSLHLGGEGKAEKNVS